MRMMDLFLKVLQKFCMRANCVAEDENMMLCKCNAARREAFNFPTSDKCPRHRRREAFQYPAMPA
jgi:hypothetical protein